jgi:hypothetical protein
MNLMALTRLFGKIRPQIFLSLCLLGTIAILAIRADMTEIGVGCIAGIIALSKDVLQSDA